MSHCAYPWQQMIIDLTGEVVPCCYWSGYGNTGKPLGNTNTSTLDEIWRGEAYITLREKVAKDDLDGHPCGNCLAHRSSGVFPHFTWSAGFIHEKGFCYLGQIADSFVQAIKHSTEPVRLLENGEPLVRPDANHDAIRTIGCGRYSVWNGWLYFSSSDNADPLQSGRRYELVCGDYRAAIGNLNTGSLSGQNLKLAYREYEAGTSRIAAEPSMISLISTADCNIDCPSCSQNMVRVTKVQHRPETVPAVLAKVPYLTQFIWHGGEPFLIKKFRDFVDNFNPEDNPNLTFGFTSNGTMITTDEVAKLSKFSRINASISIDSFDPSTFGLIRPGADLDRVWANVSRLLQSYDAPDRVFSVGMIVCKSNFVELAQNLDFAMKHDIGLNLSPVVVYPVSEQLDVFADFERQTRGWPEVIDAARRIVVDAKARGLTAVRRVDPSGMIEELARIYETGRHLYSDMLAIDCQILDPHDAIKNMRRPALIAYIGSSACGYVMLEAEMKRATLQLSRKLLGIDHKVRLEMVHDVMEPSGVLMSKWCIPRDGFFNIRLYVPMFAGAYRERNIRWANYGDSTPDGLNVRDPKEINDVYHVLYKHELRNEGGRLEIQSSVGPLMSLFNLVEITRGRLRRLTREFMGRRF